MKTVQKRSFLALAVGTGLGLGMLTGNCFSQEKYPIKTVTLIVPQAAGGANDAIARVIAQKLSEASGQTFLVDNRPGAGGNVGTALSAGQTRWLHLAGQCRQCPSDQSCLVSKNGF